jgi:hypothetical protein
MKAPCFSRTDHVCTKAVIIDRSHTAPDFDSHDGSLDRPMRLNCAGLCQKRRANLPLFYVNVINAYLE